MKPPPTRETLWRTRSRALLAAWPGVASDDGEALHQARVATRRIREALPILVAGRPARLRKVRRRIRRITRALGPVREVDVTLALLAEMEQARPSARAGFELVRAQLLADRTERRDAMQERLERIDVKKLSRRIASLVQEPAGSGAGQRAAKTRAEGRSWRAVLAARIARRAEALRSAIERAGSLYLPDRLHAVRVAVKKLRYAVELTREVQGSRARSALRRLKNAQDVLGRLHDLEVLTDCARNVQAAVKPGSQRSVEELAVLVRLLEDRCREIHASYVASHGGLLDLCDSSAAELTRALSIPRPQALRVAVPGGPSVVGRSSAADRGRGRVHAGREWEHGVTR